MDGLHRQRTQQVIYDGGVCNMSATSAHQWRHNIGFKVYYEDSGLNYTVADDYANLKFSFDTPSVSI